MSMLNKRLFHIRHSLVTHYQSFLLSYLISYSKSYLLTPWSRVLLEKLTVNFAASQEILRIYETRKFLTVPTKDNKSYLPHLDVHNRSSQTYVEQESI
jgi:hypothetical protein